MSSESNKAAAEADGEMKNNKPRKTSNLNKPFHFAARMFSSFRNTEGRENTRWEEDTATTSDDDHLTETKPDTSWKKKSFASEMHSCDDTDLSRISYCSGVTEILDGDDENDSVAPLSQHHTSMTLTIDNSGIGSFAQDDNAEFIEKVSNTIHTRLRLEKEKEKFNEDCLRNRDILLESLRSSSTRLRSSSTRQGSSFTREESSFTRQGSSFTRQGTSFTRQGSSFTWNPNSTTWQRVQKYLDEESEIVSLLSYDDSQKYTRGERDSVNSHGCMMSHLLSVASWIEGDEEFDEEYTS